MDLGLAGKRAIMTGGDGGIGRASASALSDEGARVVVAARGRRSCRDGSWHRDGGDPLLTILPARALRPTRTADASTIH